jgi:cell division protein FtsB
MQLARFHRYDILVSLACVALLSSFAWYAYKGPRGYAYGKTLDQTLLLLTEENAALATQREVLEKKVRFMRPERVDRDMLEELARIDLNMALPHELIVRNSH